MAFSFSIIIQSKRESGSALIMILLITGLLGVIFAGNIQRFGWVLGTEKRIHQKLLKEALQRNFQDQVSCSKTFNYQAQNYKCTGGEIDLLNIKSKKVAITNKIWGKNRAKCVTNKKDGKKWLSVTLQSKKSGKQLEIFSPGRQPSLCFDYLNIGPRIVQSELKNIAAPWPYPQGSGMDPPSLNYYLFGSKETPSCPANYKPIGGGVDCIGWNPGLLNNKYDYGIFGFSRIRNNELATACGIPAYSDLDAARTAIIPADDPDKFSPIIKFIRKDFLYDKSTDENPNYYKSAKVICMRCNTNSAGECL